MMGLSVKVKMRSTRRKWRISIITLVVTVTVTVTLFGVWASFCGIPNEFSLPHNLTQAAIQNLHSEAELVQRIYDEVALKLAWHGPATLGYVYVVDTCQSGTCVLDKLYLEILIEHCHICVGGRKIQHTTVTVDIDVSKPQVDAHLSAGQLWPAKAVTTDLTSVIPRLKDKAINSLEDEVWTLHPTLVLKFSLDVDSWRLSAITPDGNAIYQEKGSY